MHNESGCGTAFRGELMVARRSASVLEASQAATPDSDYAGRTNRPGRMTLVA